ncbi:MAG: response regulator transcription factor [Solirubrobacterales bacterium]
MSVIVVSSEAEMRRRIVDALAEHDTRTLKEIDSSTALEKLAADASSVIVLACDIDAPREMASLRRLHREAPEPAIVVISPPATGTGVRRALDAGADGLVFDSELELTLAATVRAVASGQSAVPRKLRASVEKPMLSHREHQVLVLVRTGLTNAEIAERLFLAESTIKSHVASIFAKCGLRSRKELIATATEPERVSLGTPVERRQISAKQATA